MKLGKLTLLVGCLLIFATALAAQNSETRDEVGTYFTYKLEEGATYHLKLNNEDLNFTLISNSQDTAVLRVEGEERRIYNYNNTLQSSYESNTILPTWKGQSLIYESGRHAVLAGKCSENGFFFNVVDRPVPEVLQDESKPEAYKMSVATRKQPFMTCSRSFNMGREDGENKVFKNPNIEWTSNGPSHSIDPNLDGLYEDVNGDRKLNQQDVIDFTIWMDQLDYPEFDFNRDSIVNAEDANKLREIVQSLDIEEFNIDDSETVKLPSPLETESSIIKVRKGTEVKTFNVSVQDSGKSGGKYRLVINGSWYHQISNRGNIRDNSFFRIDEGYAARVKKIDNLRGAGERWAVDIRPVNEVNLTQRPKISVSKEFKSWAGRDVSYPEDRVEIRLGDKVVNVSFDSTGVDSKVLINNIEQFDPCQRGIFEGYDDGIFTSQGIAVNIKSECRGTTFPRENLKIKVMWEEDLHSINARGYKALDPESSFNLKEGGNYEFETSPEINANAPEIEVKSITADQVIMDYRGFRSIVESRIECRFKGELKINEGEVLKIERKISRGQNHYFRLTSIESGDGIHSATFTKIQEAENPVTPPTSNCETGDGNSQPLQNSRSNQDEETEIRLEKNELNLGEEITIEGTVPDSYSQEYRIVIKKPSGETVKQTKKTKNSFTTTYTPQTAETGKYTAEILPVANNLIDGITNSIGNIIANNPQKTFKVIEEETQQAEWIKYCKNQGYGNQKINLKQKTNCIENHMLPTFFQSESDLPDDVSPAESLCRNLLGYSYSRGEAACTR